MRLSGSANTGWYGGRVAQPSSRRTPSRSGTRASSSTPSSGATCAWAKPRWCATSASCSSGTWCASARSRTDVGELYADFQGLGGQEWANVQVGRFQIPVGENYLRFSQGYHDNPFISNTVGGPWWWDEGLRFYGREGKFGWVASVSDGETQFNFDPNTDKQFTLKLFADPTPWLHVSASGLRSGPIGSNSPARRRWARSGWARSWARAFGAGTSGSPNYVDGVDGRRTARTG